MATSYANPGGTGDRRRVVVVGGNYGGDLWMCIDGDTTTNAFFASGDAAGKTLIFDFGNQHVIDEAKWYQNAADANGTWKWQGSNDNSAWTDIGSSFTLGGTTPQTHATLNGNATAYRWYKLLGVSGTINSSSYVREIEFRISPPTVTLPANTWITGNRTATITVTKSAGLGGVPTTDLVDGSVTGGGGFSGSAVSGEWIQFDFGVPRLVDAAFWWQSGGGSHGVMRWQGSADASSWTNIGEEFTFPGQLWRMFVATDFFGQQSLMLSLAANRTAYRYYRLLGSSGSFNGGPTLREMEFREGEPGAGPGGGILPAWFYINTVIDMYRKNTAGQNLAFVLLDVATGEALTGSTVSGYRSIDGGTQAAVTGTISEKANGQYNLALSAADCNGNQIGFLFTATGAIPVSLVIVTTVDDPTTGVAAGTAAAVWAYAIESGWSALQATRIMLSALAGKVSGANTTSIVFRDAPDTKPRISATVDQYGNRNAITYDKT